MSADWSTNRYGLAAIVYSEEANSTIISSNASDEFVFFFKQKTAYELATGYWSSDVCTSDLLLDEVHEISCAIPPFWKLCYGVENGCCLFGGCCGDRGRPCS